MDLLFLCTIFFLSFSPLMFPSGTFFRARMLLQKKLATSTLKANFHLTYFNCPESFPLTRKQEKKRYVLKFSL